jgi:putative ABC transport system ATP-binding protein
VYRLTGVTKLYQKGRRTVPAVRGLDLVIEDGEWLAVQGRTGHGKSTLLNLLGGLDRATEGSVELDGTDLGTLRETQLTRLRAESIGFIFQTFNLIPTLSAAENVEAALIPLGVGAAARRARIAAALDSVGLSDRAAHLPSEMSGGQQQRTAIARALVKDPKVVLADEPTGNLDEDTRDEIIDLLERLWRDRGLTLVLVDRPPGPAGRGHEQRPPHHQAGHPDRPRAAGRSGIGISSGPRRESWVSRWRGAACPPGRVGSPPGAGRCRAATGPADVGGTTVFGVNRLRLTRVPHHRAKHQPLRRQDHHP